MGLYRICINLYFTISKMGLFPLALLTGCMIRLWNLSKSDLLNKISQSTFNFHFFQMSEHTHLLCLKTIYIFICSFMWRKCKLQQIQLYMEFCCWCCLFFTIMLSMFFFHLFCSFDHICWSWLWREGSGSGKGGAGLECLLFPLSPCHWLRGEISVNWSGERRNLINSLSETN